MAFRFKGGIHPDYCKEATCGKSVEVMPAPALLYIPLVQHIGAPNLPLCAVGDRVLLGQIIGDVDAKVSSPVHSSVSGTVREIADYMHPSGKKVPTIVIENDFADELSPSVTPAGDKDGAVDFDELVALTRRAGIVGMGGAGFPANIKLASARGKIDTLMINGAECEPYLTSDHRLMLEAPESIIDGANILRRAFGMEKVYICVEDNKKDAIETLARVASGRDEIVIFPLPSKYPQGSEKHIIKAVTGREVPSGKLPADVKCAVFNVDSAASITRVYKTGKPVHQRMVTVSGPGINIPKNVLCRIGTPFRDVIDFCGGLHGEPQKLLMGGPMMGVCQFDDMVPVIKTTSGILLFCKEQDGGVDEAHCIRCGKCVRACPMGLAPLFLNMYATSLEYDSCDKYGMLDCIECGSCAYVCPAKLDLIARFRVGKLHVAQLRRDRAEAAAK